MVYIWHFIIKSVKEINLNNNMKTLNTFFLELYFTAEIFYETLYTNHRTPLCLHHDRGRCRVAFDFKEDPRILNLKLLMCPLSEKMTKN